jgi:peptide/nickel transport system permease protein
VTTLLAQRIPVSLHLAIAATIVALVIALPLGIIGAAAPRSLIGRAVSAFTSVALAVPTFWLGILFVLLFGVSLRWLPSSGYVPIWEDPVESLRFLVLPAATLGIYMSAIIIRFLRAALAETLAQDYIRTAHAKGVPERRVLLRHALRNALIPVLTVVALQFGAFVGGTVVTEAVFNYPGLGRLLLDAVLLRDYTVIQGGILFVVIAFSLINILVDVLYTFADPRIRLAR